MDNNQEEMQSIISSLQKIEQNSKSTNQWVKIIGILLAVILFGMIIGPFIAPLFVSLLI